MKPHVRATVAAAAISHAHREKLTSIYSHASSAEISLTVTADGNRIDGYDYVNRCQFDGVLPILFHHGEGSHIELQAKRDGKYEGFDYASDSHFAIIVRNRTAEFYDYAESAYFLFSV